MPFAFWILMTRVKFAQWKVARHPSVLQLPALLTSYTDLLRRPFHPILETFFVPYRSSWLPQFNWSQMEYLRVCVKDIASL